MMTPKRLVLLIIGLAAAFVGGYAASTAYAYPPGGIWGRAEYHGYFANVLDTEGAEVFPPIYNGEAFPGFINSPATFVGFIEGKLTGTARERIGATFIINTMLGNGSRNPPTAAELTEWETRIINAQNNGWITWRTNYSFAINSYWQGASTGSNPNDDAYYDEIDTKAVMLFRNGSGQVVYAIKWSCANPVGNGSLGPLPNAQNFTMEGSSTVSDTTVEPGQTVTFSHFVRNDGPTATDPTPIWWVGINTVNGAVTGGPASSGTYAAGQQKTVQVETVTVPLSAVPFSQICRQVGWDPVTSSGVRDGRGPPVCATVIPVFDLRPFVTVLINGAPPAAGSVAEQGDTVQFLYSVTNNGATPSVPPVNCTVYRNSFAGYHPAPTPPESTAGWAASSAGTGCPRVFPGGGVNTPILTEPIVVAGGDINHSLCRVLQVNPATYLGSSRSSEACVQIGVKPYLRVYGGDVSVGNGQPSACINSNSSIVAWNKEGASYAGAGVQYAAMAVNRINDFATALGNAAGAPAPSGLAFANTTATPPSIFGGGAGTLPCIADYYGRSSLTPTTPLPSANVSSLNGLRSYTATGPLTLSGNINPNQQSAIYVDGDVLITGNITFTGNWSRTGDMPAFQLIARGNIYVSQNVTQLDGVYIAQPSSATNGVIYTCADPALPAIAVSTSDTAMYSRCRNKLTINGSFIARDVRFLRTGGTLSQSSTAESASSPNIAEVFKFSPAVWMQQPPAPTGAAAGYDAITSLPPIL